MLTVKIQIIIKNNANNSSSGGTGGNKVTNPSQYNKYFSEVRLLHTMKH